MKSIITCGFGILIGALVGTLAKEISLDIYGIVVWSVGGLFGPVFGSMVREVSWVLYGPLMWVTGGLIGGAVVGALAGGIEGLSKGEWVRQADGMLRWQAAGQVRLNVSQGVLGAFDGAILGVLVGTLVWALDIALGAPLAWWLTGVVMSPGAVGGAVVAFLINKPQSKLITRLFSFDVASFRSSEVSLLKSTGVLTLLFVPLAGGLLFAHSVFFDALLDPPVVEQTLAHCDASEDMAPEQCRTLLMIWDWPRTSEPCKHWRSIICRDGDVIMIDLPNRGITGTLPDLSVFTKLESLNLANTRWLGSRETPNLLRGPIPSLDALTHLRTLNLGRNQLSGPIPDLKALAHLQYIDLSRNRLSGSVPDLRAVGRLRELDLSNNQLSGSLPKLSHLTELRVLALQNNNLTGPIPELTPLSKLGFLNVANNALCGEIPSSLTRLPLKEEWSQLHLNHNHLTTTHPILTFFLQTNLPNWQEAQTPDACPLDVEVTATGVETGGQ